MVLERSTIKSVMAGFYPNPTPSQVHSILPAFIVLPNVPRPIIKVERIRKSLGSDRSAISSFDLFSWYLPHNTIALFSVLPLDRR